MSASFARGAVHVVIGHNGAGKATFLSLLAGALRPTEGLIAVEGVAVEDADATLRRSIAWLPHRPFVYADLTGDESLAFVASLYGHGVSARERAEVLERVGLGLAAGRKVGTYSRGMTQRLGIAGLLVQAGDVWLLDEPTTGLDVAGREMLTSVLQEARAAGRCGLIVTHDPSLFAGVTDSLHRLERGRLETVEAE